MSTGINYQSDNPVLNNPYEEPKYYYDTDMNGYIDYNTIKPGRRPYGYRINLVPNKPVDFSMFSQDDLGNEDPNAKFINGIRAEVKTWRQNGYPKSSRITKELLDFWFNNPNRTNNYKLFFCQREAVETAVWLNEIAEKDPNIGSLVLRELMERCHSVSDSDDDVLPRTAFKMATGTGKTVVMAMLILYNYLNKRANPQDVHYADHFLICAPGITIRDRLGVLQLDNSNKSNNFYRTDYYHQRYLIPQQFEKELGGLNSSITIINFQQFIPRVYSGKHASPMDGKLIYHNGAFEKQKETESYSVLLNRILEKGVKGKRMIVINDEAHHCYLPKTSKEKLDDDEKDDLKNESETAKVWYEGLRQMKLNGYKIQHVYDLSATPYYLKGSGYPEYSLFPWVVSDFGLVDAIESGLVKIPYLPAWDNASNKVLDEPKLRNIYKYIKDKLPKRGQRGQKKKDKEDHVDRSNMPVQAPNLPTLLNTALEQFIADYIDYEKGLREKYEEQGNLFTSPPVMIIVCNNTSVSREVYREIAGYQDGYAQNGEPKYHAGKYEVFSNYDSMGLPKSKFPTLLIDSAALDEASVTIDEDFKRAYSKEIEEFKREFVNQGHGNREDITDADILREVVNTVGKPGKLGADIKCVISVSMLTEGWDANTVTHVCGIRAFGSQLLCEQVVGRALRRQSYDLMAYDKDGNEIDPDNIKRYKNVTYKFPPEYARIIGVPFNSFKGGQTVVPPPQKPKTIVRALKERDHLEMKFPVITGYRSENVEGTLSADYNGLPKFKLDFNVIPTETFLRSAVSKDLAELQTDYEDLRDEQVIYYFTHLMIREYYTDPERGPQFQKFPAMKEIVRQWYDNQVEAIGGDGSPEQKRLVLLWRKDNVISSIKQGIIQANKGHEKITAVLNYYNPEETTAHVFRPTSKPTFPTKKSHVNYVILSEQGDWSQQVAEMLEAMPGVVCYARNLYLGLRIPYAASDEKFEYQPDFIVRIKGPKEHEENVILELHHFNADKKEHQTEKQFYLEHYWITATNELKKYGTWSVIIDDDMDSLITKLNEKINQL
ncbi:MAG: BPTD_3080 family restriction endonuclease [Prevotella sp.]|jgi:type III restriction enzyme